MAEPLLHIHDLSLQFRTEAGPARVLDGVNLSLDPGEIVGLVGESGCGKTTLARAVLGMLPPGLTQVTQGGVRLDGVDMLADGPAPRAARGHVVTLVPQDSYASFNPLFSIGTQMMDLMRFRSPRRGRPGQRRADRQAVLDMLDAVQLPQPRRILAKRPHELSGGQRQRVLIAMALLPQPRLIIADEPTTALDVTVQAQILGLLRRLAADHGVSVLFTTHDLGAAWEICDRVAVMYAGQTAEVAPRAAFFSQPRHPYTAMLLRSLPEEGRHPEGIPGFVPSPASPPSACRFHPRCPRATAVCRTDRPLLVAMRGSHLTACHHPMEAVGDG